MPNINYPNNPNIGDSATYSNGSYVVWDGYSWRAPIATPITTHGVATLNFGFTASQEGDTTTTTVINANTKLTSLIIINSSTSSNHDSIEDSLIEDIKYEISDKIEGVGFTIYAYAPMGTWGEYNIEYKIIN
jgi:PKD repeat protein